MKFKAWSAQNVLEPVNLNSPSLVYQERVEAVGEQSWSEPWDFLSAIEGLPAPLGMVLPLELTRTGRQRREFVGLDLLGWLRWSSQEAWAYIPIYAFAFSGLQEILRTRPSAELVALGTTFRRLPEAISEVAAWVSDLRSGRLSTACRAGLEKVLVGPGATAFALSHHDLANDYYAAWRLWRGYGRALQDASVVVRGSKRAAIETEIRLHEETEFEWENELRNRIRTPEFQQFQVLRRATELPRYPTIERGTEIIVSHVNHGPPSNIRVLLIDDELDKGLAEVVLAIVFRQRLFTKRCRGEVVWSEDESRAGGTTGARRWVRFAAVPTIAQAACWLAHWGELPLLEAGITEETYAQWTNAWAAELGIPLRESAEPMASRELFGENRVFSLDSAALWPAPVTTVVLLDLRLKRTMQERLYATDQMPSSILRAAVKEHATRNIPVIMFTASRQALNFSQIMHDATAIDGWLIKEAPDVPSDDENSSRAVQYLLERIHLFSTLQDWYRPEFGWDTGRMLLYARFHHNSRRAAILAAVDQTSTSILTSLRNGELERDRWKHSTFHQFVFDQAPLLGSGVDQLLVGRRIAVAALLETSAAESGRLQWDAQEFNRFLPGRPVRPGLKNVYDKFSFNQELWIRSGSVLSQLLREEIDWLLKLKWPEDREAFIRSELHAERLRREDN